MLKNVIGNMTKPMPQGGMNLLPEKSLLGNYRGRFSWNSNGWRYSPDVLEVALDMRNQFDSQPHVLKHFHEIDLSVLRDSEGWVLSNPMGIRTEREIHAEFEGAKIYRRIYQKQCN
ncbi:unnamed protein product [Prunus armeniaca]